MAGIELKTISVTGKNTHCKTIESILHLLQFLGLGGKISMLVIAETIVPTIATVIILPVSLGRL